MMAVSGLFVNAGAIPNFARKYSLPCSGCHTVVPRLNETGFQFRAAGFRMPDEIGKDGGTFNIGDYLAGQVQAQVAHESSTPPGGPTESSTRMQFNEFTVFAMAGALTKNLSSFSELAIAPGEPIEIENAYVRYTTGEENSHFSARAGVFHPFEGYGASDRPIGLSRPLFQSVAADQSGSTYFTSWGFGQMGAELGYTLQNTSIRAAVLSGIYVNPEEGGASPAIGGELVKPSGTPSDGSLDFQLFANQILTEDGGGISAYLYAGQVDLPTGSEAADSAWFQNKFLRYAIYASYPIERATILAGYQQGTDNQWDPGAWAKGKDFNSAGWFAEANYTPLDLFGIGVRYEMFDPSGDKSDNEVNAIAGFANYSFGNGLQFIGEFRNRTSKQGADQKQTDNTFQLRLIWIQ